jgi:hypothetical protein
MRDSSHGKHAAHDHIDPAQALQGKISPFACYPPPAFSLGIKALAIDLTT